MYFFRCRCNKIPHTFRKMSQLDTNFQFNIPHFISVFPFDITQNFSLTIKGEYSDNNNFPLFKCSFSYCT